MTNIRINVTNQTEHSIEGELFYNNQQVFQIQADNAGGLHISRESPPYDVSFTFYEEEDVVDIQTDMDLDESFLKQWGTAIYSYIKKRYFHKPSEREVHEQQLPKYGLKAKQFTCHPERDLGEDITKFCSNLHPKQVLDIHVTPTFTLIIYVEESQSLPKEG